MYNPVKAAQLIAYIALKNENRHINVLKAVKLVYLVDRESIKLFGFPVLEETRVSMPHGPVNSLTYSYLNGEQNLDECGWSNYLEDRENHLVATKEGITVENLDELSAADIQCVDSVWDNHGEKNQWDLVDWTHDGNNIPEWENPYGSSKTIPLERIMRSVGLDNPDEQIKLLNDHDGIQNLLKELAE